MNTSIVNILMDHHSLMIQMLEKQLLMKKIECTTETFHPFTNLLMFKLDNLKMSNSGLLRILKMTTHWLTIIPLIIHMMLMPWKPFMILKNKREDSGYQESLPMEAMKLNHEHKKWSKINLKFLNIVDAWK